ncbi:MAG: hypothetical protein GY823_13500 [Flavobacteriaceae bacterium]|nr:hypothetical protein [Flavobacteriaceae bacterium]
MVKRNAALGIQINMIVAEIRNIPKLNTLLQKRRLKILQQNTRGLPKNMTFISEIFESFCGIDILALRETHIDQKSVEIASSLFEIPGYSFVSRPQTGVKGGGVAAYISESLKLDQSEDLEMEEIEVIWLEVTPKKLVVPLLPLVTAPQTCQNI